MSEDILNNINSDYKYGFSSNIKSQDAPKGISEDVIRHISKQKNEPEWLLEFRLKAYRHWLSIKEPTWANISYPKIDYQDIYYYSAPSQDAATQAEIYDTYQKLGIDLQENSCPKKDSCQKSKKVAVDAVFDSVSIKTTYQEELKAMGVIFCSISEAAEKYPELLKQYLGSVVPYTDNFFATLNSAVFSDGSFIYIPKGLKCPMELSTYFRINAKNSGQFERTLIIADNDSYVSYLEGCTAPQYDENQLHAAVVEIVVLDNAEVKYSTVQNWYPGNSQGVGGIYNFVTKRGICHSSGKLSWTQVETGSSITWKYPSCILKGDNSSAEFYSVAITNNHQQADTGTKMIHLGKNTSSKIISKGISAGNSNQTYRGLVKMAAGSNDSRNYTQCDSLLIGKNCGAHTVPYIENDNKTAQIEHEATTSKISDEQLFYCNQRGINPEDAVSLIVNGFCKDVMQQLPMEFAIEAQKLIGISLEGSVG